MPLPSLVKVPLPARSPAYVLLPEASTLSEFAPMSRRVPATPLNPETACVPAADISNVAPLPSIARLVTEDNWPAPVNASVPPLIVVAPV